MSDYGVDRTKSEQRLVLAALLDLQARVDAADAYLILPWYVRLFKKKPPFPRRRICTETAEISMQNSWWYLMKTFKNFGLNGADPVNDSYVEKDSWDNHWSMQSVTGIARRQLLVRLIEHYKKETE